MGDLTQLKRHPERGSRSRKVIDAILDEALVCHVGFVSEGQPYVIPTTHVRVEDHLVIHGSALSRAIRHLGSGVRCCVTVTLVDGLVLSRSAFGHSVNYRSVVVLGDATGLTDPTESMSALEALVEHVCPGRWAEVRPPTEKELALTGLVRISLKDASAKIRSGPPVDPSSDRAGAVWAGVMPLTPQFSPPIPDLELAPGVPLPASVLRRAGAGEA